MAYSMRKSLWILVLCFLMTPHALAGEEVWEEANQAYESENYLKAINTYSTLLEKNKQSPALHFNLANAYLNIGETARAIYHYELALQRDPRARDIRKNLAHASSFLSASHAQYQKEPADWERLLAILGFLRLGETVSFLLISIAGYFLLFSLSLVTHKGWMIFLRRILLVFSLLILVVLGWKLWEARTPQAILLESNTGVRYGPTKEERVAFYLPSGLKVTLADERPGWYRIELATGKTGWVEQNSIGVL